MKEETKKLFDEVFKQLDRIEQKLDEIKSTIIPKEPHYPRKHYLYNQPNFGCQVCGKTFLDDDRPCYVFRCPQKITFTNSSTMSDKE